MGFRFKNSLTNLNQNRTTKLVSISGIVALVFAINLRAATFETKDGHMDLMVKNKKIVQQFFDQFSEGCIDTAFTLVSDDVNWWVPGTLPFSGTKTKAQYLQIVAMIRRGFPNGFALKVTGMTAEADRVAAEVESLGTYVNGKIYNNNYHFLITIEDGKFVTVKEYMDTLHLHDLMQK